MELMHPTDIADYDQDRLVAVGVLSATHSNVRMIRLSPGQTLPPHTHESSDVFIYVVEGTGELDTPQGPQPFATGDLAQYRGDEELRLANTGTTGMTMLAFLAPVFPPASTS